MTSVPDCGEHAATMLMMGPEHCNNCTDCLALQLHGSTPPVTTIPFLTWSQYITAMLSCWTRNTFVAVPFLSS